MISDHDISEIDALDTLVNSDGWQLVGARIMAMIESTRDELERCPANYRGPGSLEGLQGHVRALRTVLGLPAILKAEYEAEAKK